MKITIFHTCREKVLPEIKAIKSGQQEASLMALDNDPDIFYSLLRELKKKRPKFNKSRLEELLPFIVNLDHSIGSDIAYKRNVWELEKDDSPAIKEETVQSLEPSAPPAELSKEPRTFNVDLPVKTPSILVPKVEKTAKKPALENNKPAGEVLNLI